MLYPYVYIIKSDIRRLKAAVLRVRGYEESMRKQLPHRCAIEFRNLLIHNINSQAFAGLYAPYNPRYRVWKSAYGTYRSEFHKLTGDFIGALRVFPFGHQGYVAGIIPGTRDRGGKSWHGKLDKGPPKPISMYGWIFERGGDFRSQKGGKHPPRPIFKPTTDEYIPTWRKRGFQALARMGKAWR